MGSLTLDAFQEKLLRIKASLPEAMHHGLDHAASLVEHEAKAMIGTEYAGWPALADSTVERKAAKGQTGRVSGTDPLLTTGELRATIGHQVHENTAIIGTPDEVGVYMEVGTSRVPPRPFLSSALHRKGEEAANAIGAAVGHALAGKQPPWKP